MTLGAKIARNPGVLRRLPTARMRRVAGLALWLVTLTVAASVAATSEAGPLRNAPAFRRLSDEASAAIGGRDFACLAVISKRPDGSRSFEDGERNTRVGIDLLVTARRALPAARRFRRAHRGVLAVEVVGQRYSRASMHSLQRVARSAMAAYPLASVLLQPLDLGVRAPAGEAPCPKVEIQVDGMPRAVVPGEPKPTGPGVRATVAAAQALARRYGRIEVVVGG